MGGKVRLGEFTAAEMRSVLPERPVILLPLGSDEDQGPHAPMGDYLCAERMAELIARRAAAQGQRTLVAPVLPFGGADVFGSVPGAIALQPATLAAVLTDLIESLLRHGLTRLIVLNGHGGNAGAIHQVTQRVYRAKGPLIPTFYLWQIAARFLPSILGEDTARRASGHGADPLASIAMHLFPLLVRKDLIPDPSPPARVLGLPVSGFGTVGFEGVDIQVPVEIDELAPKAVLGGDPRLCSPETGAALVERLTEVGARFVRHYVEQVGVEEVGTPTRR